MTAKAITETVFSEYEVRRLHMIFPALSETEQPEVGTIKCIGSMEEASEVKKVTKNCRGVPAKVRTRGTGTGTLKLTLHMPWALYVRVQALDGDKKLIEGVNAYGRSSLHPEFCLTADVFDEDDVEKFKAWPRCNATTGPPARWRTARRRSPRSTWSCRSCLTTTTTECTRPWPRISRTRR